jgi:hypothetical protein
MKSSDIDMKEKQRLLGSSATLTYHSRAGAELELEGQAGRFKHDTIVTGSSPSVQYPRLDASSPWSQPNPIEPPIDIDISYVEPCGTPAEVEASLKVEATAPQSSSNPDERVDPAEAHQSPAKEFISPLSDVSAASAQRPAGTGPLSSRGSGPTIRSRRFT